MDALLEPERSTDGDIVWHVVTASDESAFGERWETYRRSVGSIDTHQEFADAMEQLLIDPCR